LTGSGFGQRSESAQVRSYNCTRQAECHGPSLTGADRRTWRTTPTSTSTARFGRLSDLRNEKFNIGSIS
jgi:hypothetical protein